MRVVKIAAPLKVYTELQNVFLNNPAWLEENLKRVSCLPSEWTLKNALLLIGSFHHHEVFFSSSSFQHFIDIEIKNSSSFLNFPPSLELSFSLVKLKRSSKVGHCIALCTMKCIILMFDNQLPWSGFIFMSIFIKSILVLRSIRAQQWRWNWKIVGDKILRHINLLIHPLSWVTCWYILGRFI